MTDKISLVDLWPTTGPRMCRC